MVTSRGGPLIAISFIVALMLTLVPIPEWAESLRPEWVAMVLIYWCIALPDRVGIVVAFFIGLFLDVAGGALLGQNSLALSVIAYLSLKLHQRMRLFPVWQQSMSILLLVTLHQMIGLWIKGLIGQTTPGWAYWLPSVSSMLLWPLVFSILRFMRRYYRIR
ncbi:MAG: rod shape-determining protein MreD [Thiohalomonadales bacterium]